MEFHFHQFRFTVLRHFAGRFIDGNKIAIGIGNKNRIRSLFNQGAVTFFTLADGGFGFYPLGDINTGAHHGRGPFVFDSGACEIKGNAFTIFTEHAGFHICRSGTVGFVHGAEQGGMISGVKDFDRPHRTEFGGTVARDGFKGFVPAQQPRCGIGEVKNTGQAVDDLIRQGFFQFQLLLGGDAFGKVADKTKDPAIGQLAGADFDIYQAPVFAE